MHRSALTDLQLKAVCAGETLGHGGDRPGTRAATGAASSESCPARTYLSAAPIMKLTHAHTLLGPPAV